MEVTFPFAHGVTVQWVPADQMTISNPTLRRWLLDTGSLTERLQQHCGEFAVHKIGQGNAPLYANEQRWLPAGVNQRWQVREVLLCADHTPWVFARSVLPETLLQGELANLGAQPLGKRLFNDARFVRSEFELCQIPPAAFHFGAYANASPANARQTNAPPTLWGHRSRFHLNDDYIIVAEVFLAGSPAYQDA